jgi:catechol 2,3-dioxygenase-like lactoylglutathione lyase family enzyme
MPRLTSQKYIKSFLRSVLLISFFASMSSFGQLAEPNAKGVSMGHLHFQASDIEASNTFWENLGASSIQNGPINMYAIPGVLILVREAEPSSGSAGTSIIHVGFHVPDVDAAFERWSAAGIDVERGDFDFQLWVNGPDGQLIEILENPEISVPIQMHHIHWETSDIPAMQAWYSDMFGAVPGMRGQFQAADVPGVNLTFNPAESQVVGTQDTVLDHIGFEVTDLKATIARLEAAGVVMDSGYREIAAANLAIAFLTDPWGTYIELTQGLEP